MGSGKTTMGRSLSRFMKKEFIDLDLYIEARFRHSVKEIFTERGEDGFRVIERNMLHEVAEFEDVIVACGGGTPCYFDNMDYMNRQGDTIYLKSTPEVLHKHLQMGKTVRPLLLNKTADEVKAFITEQLSQREPYYLKAQHIVDVNLLDTYDKIKLTVEAIENAVNGKQ